MPINVRSYRHSLQRVCVIFLQAKAADSQGLGPIPLPSQPWLEGTQPWGFLLWRWDSFHTFCAPSWPMQRGPLSLFLDTSQAHKDTVGEEEG